MSFDEHREIEASVHNADTADTDVRTVEESKSEQDSSEKGSETLDFNQLNKATAVNADD